MCMQGVAGVKRDMAKKIQRSVVLSHHPKTLACGIFRKTLVNYRLLSRRAVESVRTAVNSTG